MQTKSLAVSGMLCGVLASLTLLAQGTYAQNAPSNVTGIAARYEEGRLHVEWEPAQDASGIAFYRIYFSRMSILENQGDYDDYERTPDAEPHYVFPAVPYRGRDLFLSVLAVNAAGTESVAFTEEARVFIPAQQEDGDDERDGEDEEETEEVIDPAPTIPLLVTHALTTSPTEVSVYFSEPLGDTPTASGVVIIDEQSARLPVEDVRMQGNTLTLTTAPQREQALYTIASLGNVATADGRMIDPGQPNVSFRGHPVSSPNGVYGPQQEEDTVPPDDARNLTLRYVLQADGSYRVDARWEASPDTDGDLASYELSTTRDGERFDQDAASVGTGVLAMRYDDLTPGLFGVLVRAKDAAGNVSEGISKVVRLPETGMGLAGMLLVSGALAGRSAVKRRSKRR